MANDGKIYITISDKRGGGGGSDQPAITPEEKEPKSKPLNDYLKHAFFNLIQDTAKKAINNTISQIGNYRGDYYAQRQIQTAISALNKGGTLALSFFAGTGITGSLTGGIVGLIATGTAMGINYGLEEFNNRVAIARNNREIGYLRELSGLNTLKDGSRGTEN